VATQQAGADPTPGGHQALPEEAGADPTQGPGARGQEVHPQAGRAAEQDPARPSQRRSGSEPGAAPVTNRGKARRRSCEVFWLPIEGVPLMGG
jgi:hypothetical protein